MYIILFSINIIINVLLAIYIVVIYNSFTFYNRDTIHLKLFNKIAEFGANSYNFFRKKKFLHKPTCSVELFTIYFFTHALLVWTVPFASAGKWFSNAWPIICWRKSEVDITWLHVAHMSSFEGFEVDIDLSVVW